MLTSLLTPVAMTPYETHRYSFDASGGTGHFGGHHHTIAGIVAIALIGFAVLTAIVLLIRRAL